MSPRRARQVNDVVGFPRASGDEPVTNIEGVVIGQFSPRERG